MHTIEQTVWVQNNSLLILKILIDLLIEDLSLNFKTINLNEVYSGLEKYGCSVSRKTISTLIIEHYYEIDLEDKLIHYKLLGL